MQCAQQTARTPSVSPTATALNKKKQACKNADGNVAEISIRNSVAACEQKKIFDALVMNKNCRWLLK